MGRRVSSFNNDIVIQKYLNGKTLDQIVKETNLSKGTVYNQVKRWKNRLGSIGVEEIREFAITVNKSGLTIQECATGFRIVQILKELGINDEFEEMDHPASEQDLLEVIGNETMDWDSGKNGSDLNIYPSHELMKRRKNKGTLITNDFHHFIEEIFNSCKKYAIKPSDYLRFIKDLNKCCSSLEYEFPSAINNASNPYLSTDKEDGPENIISLRTSIGDYDNDFPQNFETKSDESMKQSNELDSYIEIPLISQVSYLINQIKLECKELEQYGKSLHSKISVLENKKSTLESINRELVEKNNNILSNLQWYDFLKQELSDNYNMNLDEEIPFFSSIINDFKTYNYNIFDILKEYGQIKSLRKERDQIQIEINLKSPLQQSLQQQIETLNSKLDASRQTMKIYWELSEAGFNLKVLKQLYFTLVEIAIANNIPVLDAFAKFLYDIENQYDRKLGFETKIKELRATIDKLKEEIPQIKPNLQNQSLVFASLSYLKQNGVSDDDIINMSQFIISLQHNKILTNALFQVGNNGNKIENNEAEKNFKNETWKLFSNVFRSPQYISEIEKLIIQHNDSELSNNLDQIR